MLGSVEEIIQVAGRRRQRENEVVTATGGRRIPKRTSFNHSQFGEVVSDVDNCPGLSRRLRVVDGLLRCDGMETGMEVVERAPEVPGCS
jgi:hypothetical protein